MLLTFVYVKKVNVKEYLNDLVVQYNHPDFIVNDPISIPHRYSTLQDIEIAAFFAATFAWGQRKTIINKSNLLLQLMDNAPHQFITQHEETDLKRMESFVHRTFNSTDLLYFIERLRLYYEEYDSLEFAFSSHLASTDKTVKAALVGFYHSFFDVEFAPKRSRKHVASPAKKSTCKRLNMFLRWMVRNDNSGVDFGLWKSIQSSQLLIPFDVHVERMAREFDLLQRKQRDWQAVEELTNNLRTFDANDPVKYDFALFGHSVGK